MCGCLLRKREAGGGGGRANGEAEPGPAEAAPGERSAVERLILTERDDFPLEQSQDESLKTRSTRSVPLTADQSSPARPPSYPYFAILKDRLYRVTRTLSQNKIQPSCWYQKAVGKCFSRRLM